MGDIIRNVKVIRILQHNDFVLVVVVAVVVAMVFVLFVPQNLCK
jgi:hypothetical protein